MLLPAPAGRFKRSAHNIAMHTPTPFHHTTLGDPAAPTLVFLHGFLGRGTDWLPIATPLSAHFHCVLLDLPGHGKTRVAPHHTLASLAADLAHTLRAIGTTPHACIGYSMGGRLALQLALDFPSRIPNLILESASPGLESEDDRAQRRRHDDRLAQRLDCIGADRARFRRFLRDWYAQPLFATLSEDQRTQLIEHRLFNSTRQLAVALRAFSTGAQQNLWPRLPTLQHRTLLFTGARDEKFTTIAHTMHLHAPHLQHQVIPDSGHNVHFENPAGYTKALQDFLSL
jgi:2-succinyl-6-hydroxy-2,4-cyclohexadiene-1-carboxylate synthase